MYSAINKKKIPTTGYARALKFVFIQPELGGMGTGCLFQFTYCDIVSGKNVLCVLSLVSVYRTRHH